MKNLKDIVRSNLCLGCGLCAINPANSSETVKMNYSSAKGHNVPSIKNLDSENAKFGFDICPGKGYDVVSLAKKYKFGKLYHADIGYYHEANVVQGSKSIFSKKASSSGIMTQLVDYLLQKDLIDKAIVTRFDYTDKGPIAKAFMASTTEELIDSQGSKYCPVDFSEVIKEITELKNTRFAFVGTPCQIAAVREIQNLQPNIDIRYYIGNFCGGFKSNSNLRRLIKMNGFKLGSVTNFRFRGGGQPGSLRITSAEKEVEIPYPDYVKRTGFSKLKRCHLCVDATAELADFSCGDAWLDKYRDSEKPTSIVISRNKKATDLLRKMSKDKDCDLSSINIEEVVQSQRGNIASKKYRQFGRLKLYRVLGIKVPRIVEGYKLTDYSLRTEINVLVGHKVKFLFAMVR
jgi:coenzyme F420 hydrogenase subunit beta